MNPAKKSFLLLVFGLETLSWFFPLGIVMLLLGFVTVWAVVGFRWAVAMSFWGDLPGYYNQAVATWYLIGPLIPKIHEIQQNCAGITNRTLLNECSQRYLNMSSLPISIPKGLPPLHGSKPLPIQFPSWLPYAIIVVMLPFEYHFGIKPILRIKNRIREAARHIYGFH